MQGHLGNVEDIINKLALDVVTVDPEGTEKLGAISKELEDLAGLFEGDELEDFSRITQAVKAVSDKLAAGDFEALDDGIKALEEGISILQDSFRDIDDMEACTTRITEYIERVGTREASPAEETPVEENQEGPEPISMETLLQDKELIESFIMESLEHLGTIEVNVLSLEQDPENADVINAIFRPFHTIKGVSGFLNLTEINHLSHEVETLLDDARNNQLTIDEQMTDLILDAVDLLKAMIEHLQGGLESGTLEPVDFQLNAFLARLAKVHSQQEEPDKGSSDTGAAPKEDGADLGEILVSNGAVSHEDLEHALERQSETEKKLGEILIEEKKVVPKVVAGALREQKKARGQTAMPARRQEAAAFVKVDTQKLDNMVDMVGELVITQAMLGQDISELASQNKKLYSNLSQLGRITSEIQRTSMSLRMVPIKQTFHKMIRLVRDLSKKSGKQVNLEMVGEDTEIDRNMVDEIYDPLVHMVRNAVDHGIEPPDVRRSAGKPETGTVELKAYHKGGNIVIEISEDGKGLDRDRIIARAVERGLIASGTDMSDQEVYNLIFEAGFSTAEKITDVSGRGVGMDVVKRAVEKLRGKLELVSVPEKGTTVFMKMPLTLAIIDGISVRAGDRDFIIPTVSVVESIRPDKDACTSVANKGEMIKIRDSLHPLVRLHEVFDFEPQHENPWESIVVVAESDGQRKCLLVDELIGKQEVVIKSLGEHLKKVKGMAGGAILADGRVGLILDVSGLFEIGGKTTRAEESTV